MTPPSETVHWMFATGILFLGLLRSPRRSPARRSGAAARGGSTCGPGSRSRIGVAMWPVMTFYTNSAIHMLAHSAWAQALMVMGAAELGLAHGKLHSRWWKLATPVALAVTGPRSSSTSRTTGSSRARRSCTTCSAGRSSSARSSRSRSSSGRARAVLQSGFAIVLIVAVAVMLYCDRDVAPIFGHLSPLAGPPHR